MSDEGTRDEPSNRSAEDVAVGGPDTGWRKGAQRHYDPETDADLTSAIVFAIAEVAGVQPDDLKHPPLYECVDAAALEETFFGEEYTGGPTRGVGNVEFRYRDYLVTVDSDGWIQVYEPTDEPTV